MSTTPSPPAAAVVDCFAVICEYESSLRKFQKAEAARHWWQKTLLPPQSTPAVEMCLRREIRRRRLHDAEQAEAMAVCGAPRGHLTDPTGTWSTCAFWFGSDPKYNKYADFYADDGSQD